MRNRHNDSKPSIFIRNLLSITGLAFILFPALLLLLNQTVTARANTISPSISEAGIRQVMDDAGSLEQGKPVEREIKGGESHYYKINLASGQYLSLIVDQRGIDLIVRLFGPDGMQLIEVDTPDRQFGKEPVFLIAETAGDYRLELRPVDNTASPKRYEIGIQELRQAIEQDKSRIEGQKIFAEATQLRAQRTVESLKKALEKYETALVHWRAVGHKAREGDTLNNIGRIYNSLGESQKAIEFFTEVLPLFRSVEDRVGESYVLNNSGYAHRLLSKNREAIDLYKQALFLMQAGGDPRERGYVLLNIGTAYNALGERQEALDFFNQALSLSLSLGDRRGESVALNNIAAVYYLLGETRKALAHYESSLPLTQDVGDKRLEAYVLNNMGGLYDSLGEMQKALDYHNRAIPLWRVTGDRYGEAQTLNSMAVTLYSLGDNQKALDYYKQALDIQKAVGDRAGEGITLNNIGRSYNLLGEWQKALDYFNQALPLQQATGDRFGQAATLANLGTGYTSMRDDRKALDYFNRAQELFRAVGNRSEEAGTLSHIGGVYRRSGELQKGLDCLSQSLKISREIENRIIEATSLHNIGRVYFDLGEHQRALDYFDQSLQLRRVVGDRVGEAATLYSMAESERERGDLVRARAALEDALKIIESLRARIDIQELRASYFASVRDYYETYIDLLMQLHRKDSGAGYDSIALQAAERSRARSLLETLAEARADIRRGIDAQLLERESSLQQRLAGKVEYQQRLLGGKHTAEQAEEARKEISEIAEELQKIETQIRKASPAYTSLKYPEPLSLAEIQMSLDDDTLLLEYSLGKERSYLWAVTRSSIVSFELSKREEIERTARRVYELLTARSFTEEEKSQLKAGRRRGSLTLKAYTARVSKADNEYRQAAAQLSRMIVEPASDLLGRKRLIVVSEGLLQYVPFAALPLPQKETVTKIPLIIDHEIVSLPSASTLALQRRDADKSRSASKTLAVIADPVFSRNDNRVLAGHSTEEKATPAFTADLKIAAREVGIAEAEFSRLTNTRFEAEEICSLVGSEEQKQAFDFEANRAMAMSGELAQYRIIHFATHGFINELHPGLSGLVLSLVDKEGNPQDGFLRLQDTYNLNLSADLVVLSACKTGVGRDVRGEGMIGLTRGFMYAGASRVVASLWNADDAATAYLMKRFYKVMLGEKRLSPAAALREAQLEMLKKRNYSAPYYWAAFLLQGEWR
jgi:CHAT domain-containing protein/Tfp pilus assembly protein PilF